MTPPTDGYLIWRGRKAESIDRVISDGCERYHDKYGAMPTEVRVADARAAQVTFAGIAVIPDRRLHPDEVWVGSSGAGSAATREGGDAQ